MLIAPLENQAAYSVREQGPASVAAASARFTRDSGQNTQGGSPRSSSATTVSQPRGGTQIAGSAPSLSTSVIGTLGGSGKGTSTTSLPRIDPLTGKPMDVDPITGEPIPATPLSVALDAKSSANLSDSGVETLEGDTAASGPSQTGAPGNTDTSASATELTPEEKAEVARLQALDRQVRAHEAAHKAAGIGVTGPATFTYTTGPDGRQYAVAGEVPIVTTASPADPEQAVEELEQVKQAALAPSDPSPADRAAAAAAQAAQDRAEQEVRVQEQEDATQKAAQEAERDAERQDRVNAREADQPNDRQATTASAEALTATGAQRTETEAPADTATTAGNTATTEDAQAVAGMTSADTDFEAANDDEEEDGSETARNDRDETAAPYAFASAAYSQTASMIGGAPLPTGDPTAVVEPQTLFSLVA